MTFHPARLHLLLATLFALTTTAMAACADGTGDVSCFRGPTVLANHASFQQCGGLSYIPFSMYTLEAH